MQLSIVKIRSLIGLIQGILLAILYTASQKMSWPATQPSMFVPLSLIALFIPFIWLQGINNLRLKTLGVWTAFAALLLLGIGYYSVFRQMLPYDDVSVSPAPAGTLVFFTTIAFIIAHSLVLSSDHDGRWIANYPTYFDMAWKMVVQVLFAAMFVLGLWIILELGASLFSAIGLTFFQKLINHSWFAIPVTTIATSIALHITDVNVKIVQGIRTLSLMLLSWLLPLITGIVAIFLISLCFTGVNLLWKTGYATSLLLSATSLLVLLINAVYQDGGRVSETSNVLRFTAPIACCLLSPLLVVAMYALNVRVQQYGWTVNRIEGAAFMLMLACYALGYIAAVWSSPWLKRLEICNVLSAYFMLLVYLAIFSPLADPARLAVASQIARLESGKVAPERFDFGMLRLQGLRYGQEALIELQAHFKGLDAAYTSEQVKKLLALKKGQVVEMKTGVLSTVQKADLINVHTNEGKLPESFLNQDWRLFEKQVSFVDSLVLPSCLSGYYPRCDAWVMEYNNNPPVILILAPSGFIGIKQDAQGVWNIIGGWALPFKCTNILRDAREGRFKVVAPSSPAEPDIQFDGWRTSFRGNSTLNSQSCK
ncbi:MAG: DUF4153 domain-containing protein [Gammaproteobacteria bacterium]